MFGKLFTLGLIALSSFCAAQEPLRDIQQGLQGLKQLGNDPEAMAQLMRDMQDPEMMAAAKKMMDDPKFKSEMKKLSNSKEFKDSVKTTTEMLSDPNKAAAAEARMEHMAKVGHDQYKKTAQGAVDAAMDAMTSDPEVMDSMAKMVKDPSFKKQFDDMMKDPNFRVYMESMQEMMKDPSKKAKFERAAQGLKAAM